MSFFGLGGPGTALEQLNAGLATRTALDTQFQLDLFNRILQLLRELQNCPAAVAALPSGTAGALTITQAELTDFIQRLENPNNMDDNAIEDIVDPIYRIGNNGDRSLRRTPGLPVARDASGAVPRAAPRGARAPSSSGSPGSPGSGSSGSDGSGSSRPFSVFSPSTWSRSGTPTRSATPVRLSDDLDLSTAPGGPLGVGLSRYGNALPSSTPRTVPSDISRIGGKRTRRARKYRNRT